MSAGRIDPIEHEERLFARYLPAITEHGEVASVDDEASEQSVKEETHHAPIESGHSNEEESQNDGGADESHEGGPAQDILEMTFSSDPSFSVLCAARQSYA